LKKRIFLALLFSFLGTVLGAWLLAGGGVLKPLAKKLIESRADVVATLADEVEKSSHPKRRLNELSKRLQIEAKLRKKPFKKSKEKFKKIEREGRWIIVLPGRDSPMMTPIEQQDKKLYLVVVFPISLEAPKKKIATGLLLLAGCVTFAAWGLSRWSVIPLEMATEAMNKITNGDLSHRVDNDIGEAKDAFNQMAARVETVILGQRDLIAAISHELKTPLTRLRLQTELLADEGVSQQKLDRLNEDIRALNQLVDILLSSAKLEQGSVALQKEDLNIKELIILALSKIELFDRYIKIDVSDKIICNGDKHLLLRAFTNIFSNIARYTPEDCIVEINAIVRSQQVFLEISDTGDGVSDSFLPQLFSPFVREEKSRSKVTGGLGLGLMFVRKVLQAHQGNIQAKSNHPTGLVLMITLPLQV